MTGGFSWESILEYVSSYNPLDSGVDSACEGFACSSFTGAGLALSVLLFGQSIAEYGYVGYLVLFIQKQGMYSLKTSVIVANVQKGFGALFGVFLVYMAKFRMGLARMILYTYATFISGSQLLWFSPSKRSSRRSLLGVQLLTLRAGYAGEKSTSYVYGNELKKAEQRSRQRPRQGPKEDSLPPQSPCSKQICGTKPGCMCCHLDNRLIGCIAPAATAREGCVSLFLGEQYNWRPHVCPIVKEGAREEGIRTCCCLESSCTEKQNSGDSSVKDQKKKSVKKGPQDTEEEMDCKSIELQQENAEKMSNRIKKKLFAAKLPGTILGTVLAAVFSTEVFIKISTAVAIICYNLFFWMGAQCYDLGEMENDITNENKSGEMKKQDKKGEEKIDGKCGKHIPVALVPELTLSSWNKLII
ncbi:hypothetical protein SLEP1_g44295 [Rubroshorea leprosula]|uniref:Uncharacterized protein n=1 Tax=Rubroshorea leprosula TaxID=152421 RepID=A0AAV5LFR4_9ROSI|nr:hypothetical protein SLEP1_g44295 [Rubroshorea leprosula]